MAAKSIALIEADSSHAVHHAGIPHTMWAKEVDDQHHKATNTMSETNIRSAMAPMMRPGVMMANIN
ncbi:MAG: hypothetical protein U1F57_05810 [bacterium]